ncbi:MAG: HEAT repeat domain-containing protein [Nitrospirota bacterium]
MPVDAPTYRDLIAALVELHQTGRKLLLYPPTHALIPKAIDNVLRRFNGLWTERPEVTITVGAKHLSIGGEPLDPQNPMLVELTRALSTAHVARLTIRQGLDGDGLTRFFTWFHDKSADAVTRQANLMAFHQAVPAITIALVSFRGAVTETADSARSGTWDQLLDALLEAGVGEQSQAEGLAASERERPERVAELVNRAAASGDSARYERLVLEHLQRLAAPLRDPVTGENRAAALPEAERRRLVTLIERLDPPVRERLFRLAFNPESQGPGALVAVLDQLSEPVLLEVLCQIQAHQGAISIPTLELLRKFVGVSRERPELAPSVMEHLDGLDLADRHALYAELFHKKSEKNFYPENYANTIKGLSGTAPSGAPVSHEPVQDLVDPVGDAEIHRHLVTIMTELVQHPSAAANQSELVDQLARAFEDPLMDGHADVALHIFDTLKRLNPDDTAARGALQASMARVIAPVVRALPKMDKARGAAVADQLVATGEPVVRTLLDVLNNAPDMVLRKRLLDILARIGRPIAPAVMEALGDERWFVVRNMILLLGETKIVEAAPKIITFAGHTSEQVRIETLRALGQITPLEQTLDLFSAATLDSDERVASCAIGILCQRPTPKVVDRLQDLFESDDKRLPDPRKLKIIDALARGKDPSCVALLSRLAKRRRFIFFDLSHQRAIRRAAREALRRHRLMVSVTEDYGRAA